MSRTTVENKKDLQYDLHLENVDTRIIRKPETSLIRGTFYDFGAKHESIFYGYSDEPKSEFVESLFCS